jgi:hypothetical protein
MHEATHCSEYFAQCLAGFLNACSWFMVNIFTTLLKVPLSPTSSFISTHLQSLHFKYRRHNLHDRRDIYI